MPLSIDKAGSTAVLDGPWTAEDSAAFERARPTRLVVGASPDLDFLKDLPPLRDLEVHRLPLRDISPVAWQTELRSLSINAYFKVGVDFSKLPALETLHLDWGPGAETLVAARGLEDLSINRLSGTDLSALRPLTRLRRLRLANSRSITSLDGIGAFRQVEAIRLLDLRSLVDLSAIGEVAKSLRSLEFNTCRRIGRLDAIASLHALTRLLVNNCGNIESLAPVAGIPLRTFLFYEATNIVDGRVDRLLEMADLRDTAFADRRHYTHTLGAIEAALAGRR
ncbi:MAG: hypothetical protein H0U52_00245 [Chloroflexi bacterium]|nr:hypothetical protein [Chloroflexota bacterium]